MALGLVLAVGVTTAMTAGVARADDPVPVGDPIGAYQTTPNSVSVPGYTAPADPAKPTAAEMKPEQMVANIHAVAQSAAHSFYSINFVWTLVAGFLVMFMQAGFALVETGLCRAKNAAHTMSMNFLVYALGMTGFFICGYAFMCGGANGTAIGGPGVLGGIPVLNNMVHIGNWGIIGKTGFFLTGKTYDSSAIVWFLFMMVFMDTTATIPTGALAERWSTKSFFLFSLCIGAIIYPIYGGWVWGGGWLAQLGLNAGMAHGVVDYAGSGVVHLQGGALALITSFLLGPRIGKYDSNGKPKAILGHHIPMVILGTFILAFGWFGFNAGSSLAGEDGRIGIIAVNTMLASASGALASCLYMWCIHSSKKPDPSMMCNGMLAGLVAITAPCAFVTPWAAFLIGAIAGVLVIWSVFFWEKMGIDDPVGAISVHGVNGAWGLIALGLFADGTYGAGFNGVGADKYMGIVGQGVTGLFYGDSKQFMAEIIDVAVCVGWNVIIGGTIFFVIGKVLGTNRVPAEVEIAGLDIPEVGIPGYPEFFTPMVPEQVDASEIAAAKASIRQLAGT
ncbi:MAG TPA: ammonium transporter [Tepidisphaeraceae bacterium]|jgi:Amt family ammonium transporter|nr:ammonium transporter [Tepidisphaeraceae bacterium]